MEHPSTKVVSYVSGQKKKLAYYNATHGRVVIQNVREEDEYMEHLGQIIQRDYFPDLPGTIPPRKEEESSNQFDTSSSGWNPPEHCNPEKPGPADVSLDTYLANNTTEDDASFAELIEHSEREHKLKLQPFFPAIAAAPSSEQESTALDAIECSSTISKQVKPLAIGDGKQVTVGPRSTLTDSNMVHFNPPGVPLTPEETLQHKAKERHVISENTRFKRPLAPVKGHGRLAKLAAASSTFGKISRVGLDGKELSSSIDGTSTPTLRGFKLLDPSASPIGFSPSNASPLMTWGELAETPSRIDGDGSTTPSTFRIASPSMREQLAHKLADKASRQRADKRQAEAIKRASSKSPNVALSPAARRLLVRSGTGGSSISSTLLARHTSPFMSLISSRPGTGQSSREPTPASSSADKTTAPGLGKLQLGVVKSTCIINSSSSATTPSSTVTPSIDKQQLTTCLSEPIQQSDDSGLVTSVAQSRPSSSSITDNLLDLKVIGTPRSNSAS